MSSSRKTVAPPPPPVAIFTINIGGDVLVQGPDRQVMHVGFISLRELHEMFKVMGPRLFDRNIRGPLARRDGGKSTSVNQKITETLKRVVLEQTLLPSAFSFMHNGVTLYAQRLLGRDGQYEITEPRILNGAQTVATVAQFAERHGENPNFKANLDNFRELRVLCKIVANAEDDFIRAVTVSTNRQNPVHPANLRANDLIQRQIADWFRESRERDRSLWAKVRSVSASRFRAVQEGHQTRTGKDRGVVAGRY